MAAYSSLIFSESPTIGHSVGNAQWFCFECDMYVLLPSCWALHPTLYTECSISEGSLFLMVLKVGKSKTQGPSDPVSDVG